MTSNVDDFKKKLRDFTVKVVPAKLGARQRAVTLFALRGLVEKTPVDTGRARGNWQVGNNTVPGDVLAVESKGVGTVVARERPAVSAIQPFSRTTIANNVPYIGVLENGGFVPPNPDESLEASAIRAAGRTPLQRRRALRELGDVGGTFVAGGYSKQAPQGMLQLTFLEAVDFARRAGVLDEQRAAGGAA